MACGLWAIELVFAVAVAQAILARGQQVELLGHGQDQFVHAVAPVAADRRGALGNGHEIPVRKVEAADVRAGKAQILHRRHHQRRALQAFRLLFLFQPLDQFVGNHAARHFPCLHHLRDLRRGDVNVGQHRNVPQAFAVHVLLQFVELAQVVSQLGDDELRPRGDLQLQFVELHHLVGFVDLVRVHHGAGEEIERRAVDGARPQVVLNPLAHGFAATR